jgi:hypothetical protein
MVTHKLNLETEAHDQDIICVNTALPAYVFVFELNKLLGLSLFRCEEDLVPYVANHTFAVYEYNSAVMQQTWRVIENRFNTTISETETAFLHKANSAFVFFLN